MLPKSPKSPNTPLETESKMMSTFMLQSSLTTQMERKEQVRGARAELLIAGIILGLITLTAGALLVYKMRSQPDDEVTTPTLTSEAPSPSTSSIRSTTATTTMTTTATTMTTTTTTAETTRAATTTEKMTFTSPRSTPKPLDAQPLLCTYGLQTNLSTTLPDDGLCDLIFFDSLYKEHRNRLSDPSRFGDNLRRIMGAAPQYRKTGFGVAFAYEHRSTLSTDLANRNSSPLSVFWASNIHHFGIVDMPASVVELSQITSIFYELQELSRVVQQRPDPDRPAYIVLGAVPVTHGDFFGTRMRDIYSPTLFISQGHYAFGDNEIADCMVMPPTSYYRPKTATGYTYDLIMAAKALENAQTAGGRARWLISVGMKGRWSRPLSTQPLRMSSKCIHDRLADSFGRYAEVCTNATYHSNLQYDPDSEAMYTNDPIEYVMFVYDNEEGICKKLCDIKKFQVLLRFGIAAYDLEYEDYTNICSSLNKYGAFSRLKMIRNIVDYFRTVTDDAKDCTDYVPCS